MINILEMIEFDGRRAPERGRALLHLGMMTTTFFDDRFYNGLAGIYAFCDRQ
jgi:hypothetical protein